MASWHPMFHDNAKNFAVPAQAGTQFFGKPQKNLDDQRFALLRTAFGLRRDGSLIFLSIDPLLSELIRVRRF